MSNREPVEMGTFTESIAKIWKWMKSFKLQIRSWEKRMTRMENALEIGMHQSPFEDIAALNKDWREMSERIRELQYELNEHIRELHQKEG